jgi:predicted AlkP superfamily pyrophosphatase or phosphodiesterase
MRAVLCVLAFSIVPSIRVAAADASPGDGPVPVVLMSIDGLKPDYVLEADKHGLKIPHLRRLVHDGAYASGVAGVVPTVTYPAHTTMVTGVSPARHGILNNGPFDPLGRNLSGWYWYAEDIRVPTLWDAAAEAGMVTTSVDWPVTVGARITYNIVQYWRAATPDDHKILRALTTPGLLGEAERAVGPYPTGNDYTVAADRRRAAFSVFLLETKKPRLHLCYFSGLDTEQHRSGPYSAQAFAALEQIDELVGQVRAAAERAGGGRAVLCVVSDHGFARADKDIHLNAALAAAGLMALDAPARVRSWQASAWMAGGSAAIMLEDPHDQRTIAAVREILDSLRAGPEPALQRVLAEPDPAALGGFPGASFVVSAQPGYRFGSNLVGPVVLSGKAGGTHGYLPELAEMNASFFLVGPGVPPGYALDRIDMRDIAPTLAARLGVPLADAEGKDVLRGTPAPTSEPRASGAGEHPSRTLKRELQPGAP